MSRVLRKTSTPKYPSTTMPVLTEEEPIQKAKKKSHVAKKPPLLKVAILNRAISKHGFPKEEYSPIKRKKQSDVSAEKKATAKKRKANRSSKAVEASDDEDDVLLEYSPIKKKRQSDDSTDEESEEYSPIKKKKQSDDSTDEESEVHHPFAQGFVDKDGWEYSPIKKKKQSNDPTDEESEVNSSSEAADDVWTWREEGLEYSPIKKRHPDKPIWATSDKKNSSASRKIIFPTEVAQMKEESSVKKVKKIKKKRKVGRPHKAVNVPEEKLEYSPIKRTKKLHVSTDKKNVTTNYNRKIIFPIEAVPMKVEESVKKIKKSRKVKPTEEIPGKDIVKKMKKERKHKHSSESAKVKGEKSAKNISRKEKINPKDAPIQQDGLRVFDEEHVGLYFPCSGQYQYEPFSWVREEHGKPFAVEDTVSLTYEGRKYDAEVFGWSSEEKELDEKLLLHAAKLMLRKEISDNASTEEVADEEEIEETSVDQELACEEDGIAQFPFDEPVIDEIVPVIDNSTCARCREFKRRPFE